MKKILMVLAALLPLCCPAQHDHNRVTDSATSHSHLAHTLASRAENIYVHNLPAPKLMAGVGNSKMRIETKSSKTQDYFNQGISLLHDFWDFEAYRAFKEAIRNDSNAIMPYWGLLMVPGSQEDSIFKSEKEFALKQVKKLMPTANGHEKLYAEIALLGGALTPEPVRGVDKKYELIVHKFPDDINAKLFLALTKMSGFDTDKNPMEGQMYSEFLLRDVQRTDPDNHAFLHYWIHLMEDCCPEQAVESANLLTAAAPASGHIVHMPGHIYYRIGDYKKAHDAFVASFKVDSAYMKNQGIKEVDTWNYIHNINYLLNNCVQDGRRSEGLYYAEKLKRMPINKNRKKIYDGRFFIQGLLAPAKMEMAFGDWDNAAVQLDLIVDNDNVFSYANMQFKEGLTFFAGGMDALSKNNINDAVKYSNSLDALLWRIQKQSGKDSALNPRIEGSLNTASLELQGKIAGCRGNYETAIRLLEKANKNEIDLGYSEPPFYTRPVAISIGDVYIKAGKYDKAIETYHSLLNRFPKSALVYDCLYKVYLKKGDVEKVKEYKRLLQEATKYADVDRYSDFLLSQFDFQKTY